MTKQQYEKISTPFRENPRALFLLTRMDKGITAGIFAAYPLLLLYLFFTEREKCLPCLFIPAVSFYLISVFRKIYSAKRPYEVLDITPLICKHTVGKSFPSRHVFSAFIIGMTFFYINKPLGIFVGILGVLMALVRVVGGVHFPKDVIAGGLAGILWGLVYFIL